MYIDPDTISCASIPDEGGWGIAIVLMPSEEFQEPQVLLSQYISKHIGDLIDGESEDVEGSI